MSLDPEWEFYREKIFSPGVLIPYKRNLFDQEMKDAAMRVLEKIAMSEVQQKEVRAFEKEFAYFCGRKYAIMFGSTLHGLYLSLRLQGFSPRDEIILAPNIEPANANVIVQAGAKPVFVDAEKETLNIDVRKIEEKITKNTKAIHPIHAHGHPADMDPVIEIARENDLLVVEDCTHATGSKYKGRRLPVGDIGIFGMVLKCLWLPTSGAMVVTDDEETIKRLRMLQSWPGRRAPGEVKDFKGEGIIHSLKTISDDISATVGRIQLRHLEEYTEIQRRNAKLYTELLEDTPLTLPVELDYAEHAFLRYIVRHKDRDALKIYLNNQGIECAVSYKTPAHLYNYYKENFGTKIGDCPVAEEIKKTELGLPEPTRSRSQWEIEYTAKRVKEFFGV